MKINIRDYSIVDTSNEELFNDNSIDYEKDDLLSMKVKLIEQIESVKKTNLIKIIDDTDGVKLVYEKRFSDFIVSLIKDIKNNCLLIEGTRNQLINDLITYITAETEMNMKCLDLVSKYIENEKQIEEIKKESAMITIKYHEDLLKKIKEIKDRNDDQ